MQIHELTQPRKSQLDEIDMVGPGGLGSELVSAWRNKGTVYNPKDMVKSLLPTKSGAEARQRLSQAQADADQSEYARRAATAAGKIQSQLKPPTLDQSLDKLKANPQAQQWINDIVAKWPAEANKLATTTATPAALSEQGIKEAPEYTTPGGIVVPGGAKTASQTDTQAYATKFRSWVDSQLKTTKLAKLESDPQVKSILEPLLQQIVAAKDNPQAQQKLVHDFFSYAVAANHVVQATTQGQSPEQGQDQGTVATGNEIAPNQQAVDTGLNKGQLYNLYQKANAAGGPRPKSTGNPFYDSLIAQIRGGR